MFDNKRDSYEKKFNLDAEKKFKITSLRNKMLGKWIASLLDLEEERIDDYVKDVIISDLELPGDEDVIAKVLKDCEEANVKITREIIEEKLNFFYNEALKEFTD
tara:strand:+ start:50 stop:361 length:312 start_codon:yes stop_codon:yes gene_type:complete